jgi:hypothetical protein
VLIPDILGDGGALARDAANEHEADPEGDEDEGDGSADPILGLAGAEESGVESET